MKSPLMKIIKFLLLISLSLNSGCIHRASPINHKKNVDLVQKTSSVSIIDKNIIWYPKEIIQDIEKIDEKKYQVHIGISAQVFYLDSQSENVLKVLNYSLKNNKNIKIGIENNTSKILFANKLNE